MTNVALQIDEQGDTTCPRSGVASIAASLEGADVSWLDEGALDAVSAQEISELVFGALQDAIQAAGKPCSETYLSILEGRKRDRIIAQMKDLPPLQMTHPVTHAELLKEFAMMHEQSQLANGIVESIRNYARSKRRALMAAMT